MINEATDWQVRQETAAFFTRARKVAVSTERNLKRRRIVNASINDEEVGTGLLRLRALGLIRENQKARSVKDTQTYWTLTPYCDSVMTQLRAIRRDRDG